jgi:cytochrome P450
MNSAFPGQEGSVSAQGAGVLEPGGVISLHGAAFAADPHAAYEIARSRGPITPVELAPGVEVWLVTSHTLALHVLQNPGIFAKDPRRWRALREGRIPADSPVLPMMEYRPNCLFADGIEHMRLRQAVTESLNKIDLDLLRRNVERSADYLIQRFSGRGSVDLLGEYAKTLPLLVISQLFGAPVELGDRLIAGITGIFDGVDPEGSNKLLTEALVELVTLKRGRPENDVTSWLLTHATNMTDEEAIHQLVTLMSAGTEPLRNLIASSLRLLLSQDGEYGGSRLVDEALNEVLWRDPPIANYAPHYPVQDVQLGDVLVQEGDAVIISFAAANSDPGLVARSQMASDRAHLAWGAGPHACPAKDPATLVALTAVERLLNQLPDIELAAPADSLAWRPGPFHRALLSLPATFTPVEQERPPQNVERPRPAPAPAVSTPNERRGVWSSFMRWWRGEE